MGSIIETADAVSCFQGFLRGYFYGGKNGKLTPGAEEKERFQTEETFSGEQIGGCGAGLF